MPEPRRGEVLLRASRVSRSFGGLKAVDDVSVEVRLGTVHAVIGTNGRGSQHAKMFSRMPGVEIGFVCDPDEKALAKGMKAVSPTPGSQSK